ncbi:hypothetical protein ES332_D05G391400v1 [Gossypium tomentosum]|uniref:Uncharacterized protein n=1 Tax=Gossypium tomentosum TaxID=34277 RepID=A0A5D2L892_GOSTO|nr:hypothetical protein ES332_D05G391400v1 [Gossypium tomentosum]
MPRHSCALDLHRGSDFDRDGRRSGGPDNKVRCTEAVDVVSTEAHIRAEAWHARRKVWLLRC